MKYEKLPSGRIVVSTYADKNGWPRYYEYFDTKTGALRLAYGPYWDGNDRSRSITDSATLVEFYELIEWVMEAQQMTWRPDKRNGKLIWFMMGFQGLVPTVGDRLAGSSGKIYTVQHVPIDVNGRLWNLSVLLDAAPTLSEKLTWIGDARDRNLIDFRAEYGSPDTPTAGEATDGDVGTAYRKILRPTITYLLLRKEPYTIRGAPFSGSKELKPRIREYVYDQDLPQRVLEILAQRMENLIRFTCLHPRAETADALAHWFERCINRQIASVRANGIHELLFWSSRTVERRNKTGDDAAAQEVSYYVVTEEIDIKEVSSLRRINVTINAAPANNSDSIYLTGEGFPEPGWLAPLTGVTDESGNWIWGNISVQDYGYTGSTP
jgi:hypothetical protein